MFMKKTFLPFLLIAFLLTSCVKDEYNLNKDISTEMELFSDGIELPIGYTNKLSLDSLADGFDQLAVNVDGEYSHTIPFDIGGDILDIFFKTGSVELAGVMQSSFDFRVNLHLSGVDTAGNKIAGLYYEEEVLNKNFAIRIESSKLELLKKTKEWEMVFLIRTATGAPYVLQNDDYIQLLDLKFRKRGGIVINDLSDLNL